jgi:autotransporter translocation and assembly factor TamB
MNLEIESADVALTDLDPLLPPDINLEGTCKVQFSATGRADNPSLNGSIRTQNLQIESAKRAQIAPDVQVDLGGTMARPAVKGIATIRSGYIRVPEQQSQLHPSEGSSILRQAADSAWAAADTTGLLAAIPDSLDIPEIDAGLDLDVRVVIPGSFRIIGSRMNIVLSGDLHLVQQGENPLLTGQLIPESGDLLFMGRSFEVRRGSVNFYGGDELNPGLDLTLTAEVSGHRIEIRLTGSLKDPELALTSDPQLAESDIVSLLVFGKPMGELSTSQTGHVQQRTTEILLGYGAVKLQEQMSGQMGVDIVTIKQSTRQADESALVVGKYLNSRTLIRYEQNIENTGTYLLNLEYILTKRLKLQTYVDQASATGVEINWSNDW